MGDVKSQEVCVCLCGVCVCLCGGCVCMGVVKNNQEPSQTSSTQHIVFCYNIHVQAKGLLVNSF